MDFFIFFLNGLRKQKYGNKSLQMSRTVFFLAV
ncbi:hypothetical protein NC653_033458 [Populus alba x Populus x berolinensis]|uniref:Uncharacterized protein n=1 Tax=Populus alba x Populus x berolinensis TaxID=444605 RepID=A0AAD6Q0C3_9ROSI|nr:hypothetical protein NC653_033458 [Populus alba x Populus x berolinensis]